MFTRHVIAYLRGVLVITMLCSLLTAAVVASTPAQVQRACGDLLCTHQSDCGTRCFCNNPQECQGCGTCEYI